MERATLLEHRVLWVSEQSRETRDLDRLTGAERALYEELRENRLGESVRLEQERIGFSWLERALSGIEGAT